MSRISLHQRLAALRDKITKIEPFAVAVYNMKPSIRLRYDNWLSYNRRMIAEVEQRDGPGGAYAAMIDGTLQPEPVPEPIRVALGLPTDTMLTDDMSAQQVADRWTAMIEAKPSNEPRR